MEKTKALSALSALSHDVRLDVFRELVKVGPNGLVAGEIGQRLGVRQNTLSTNLSSLLGAGLVRNRREGRTIRYFAEIQEMQALIAFLVEDCCGGRRLYGPPFDQPVWSEGLVYEH